MSRKKGANMTGTRKQRRARLHVDVGETSLTAYLCDGDRRADLLQEAAAGKHHINPAFYTLDDLQEEGRTADAAMALALAWGLNLPG